jgi:hypothetical protein
MKKVVFVVMLFFVSVISYAQLTPGKSYLGPAVGFYFDQSTITLGANYEYAINKNIAVGGIFRYTSYDAVWWDCTHILIGAQGNYHFEGLIDDEKWDPFAGVALGISSLLVGGDDIWGIKPKGSTGLFFNAHATMRYWINPGLGVQARVEFGSEKSSSILLGVDFKF